MNVLPPSSGQKNKSINDKEIEGVAQYNAF
jgi:hypothetical protein